MKKIFALLIFIIINFYSLSLQSEEALTIKQQLDRIMQEVSDLNKAVFNKSFDKNDINSDDDNYDAERFTSIDVRIYDLEKDIKNLTLQFEEIAFKLDDISDYIKKIENEMSIQFGEIKNATNSENDVLSTDESTTSSQKEEKNTLGKLVLSSDSSDSGNSGNSKEIKSEETTLEEEINVDEELSNLSPEEQLQLALDQMMKKNYNKSKVTLEKFIKKFPENKLSGSAHFWLGKIYQFESNHRKAAIIFTEGVQKFPLSIKAAEMYYELSKSLMEMNKFAEACMTLKILDKNYKGNKFTIDPDNIKDKLACEDEN